MVRILSASGALAADEDGWTRISLALLVNQSHARAEEFEVFRRRLAELLSRAGEGQRIRFDVENKNDRYQMRGGVYLRSAYGLDVWEFFPSLVSTRDSWTVWRAEAAIMVLRQPRANQPQILIQKAP